MTRKIETGLFCVAWLAAAWWVFGQRILNPAPLIETKQEEERKATYQYDWSVPFGMTKDTTSDRLKCETKNGVYVCWLSPPTRIVP